MIGIQVSTMLKWSRSHRIRHGLRTPRGSLAEAGMVEGDLLVGSLRGRGRGGLNSLESVKSSSIDDSVGSSFERGDSLEGDPKKAVKYSEKSFRRDF